MVASISRVLLMRTSRHWTWQSMDWSVYVAAHFHDNHEKGKGTNVCTV